MTNRARWGILSTARINRRVIPAIGQSSRAELCAVASRSKQKAETYASQWDIEKAYGSYEALLDDPDIDVVYISLPNDMHTEWILKSLEAGKHVLCEKPICLGLEDFDRIGKAQEETGKYVAEAFMYLHHPQTHYFKEIIDRGDIGDLRSMMSTFTFFFERDESNYRVANMIGGGSLWDVGVYPISLFQFLTGSPPEKCSGFGYPDELDMRFSAALSYPGGIVAQFTSGFDSAFSTQTLIQGTTGSITISHPYTFPLKCKAFLHTDSNITELELPRHELYIFEIEDMCSVVLEGKSTCNFIGGLSKSH